MKRVLLMLNISEKSSRDRLSGFLRYNLRTKWEVFLFDVIRGRESPAACAKVLRESRPDGIVYLASAAHMLAKALRTAALPTKPVLVCSHKQDSDEELQPRGCVKIDNDAIVRASVEALAHRGISHFGFMSPSEPTECADVSERLHAFQSAMREPGRTGSCFIASTHTRTPKIHALANWLKKLPKPCGIVLYNDSAALAGYAACRRAGLAIPDQVLFVGVDNDPIFCENVDPSLSSVEPDFEGSGFLSARQLDACFTRDKPEKFILDYGVRMVVERASTMDLSGALRYVFRAREYLQHHSDERLTVTQIAKALTISPRLLEKHFASTTGHTLQQEMLHQRLNRLCHLLTTTSRPINNLIYICGWNSISSATKIFKDNFGLTMREWRKRNRIGLVSREAVAKPPFPHGRATLCRGRGRDGARPSQGFATASRDRRSREV